MNVDTTSRNFEDVTIRFTVTAKTTATVGAAKDKEVLDAVGRDILSALSECFEQSEMSIEFHDVPQDVLSVAPRDILSFIMRDEAITKEYLFNPMFHGAIHSLMASGDAVRLIYQLCKKDKTEVSTPFEPYPHKMEIPND
jgi:hypothetical protein